MTNDNTDSAPFEKKTERLDIRVSYAKKKAFAEACENQGDTPSNAVRRFISTYVRREQRDEMAAAIRFSPWKRYLGYFAIGGILLLGAGGVWSAFETQKQNTRTEELFAVYDDNKNRLIDLGEIAPNDYHLQRVLNIDGVDGISMSEFAVQGRMMWKFVNAETYKIVTNGSGNFGDSSVTTMRSSISKDGKPINPNQKTYVHVEGELVELPANMTLEETLDLISKVDIQDPQFEYSDEHLAEMKKYVSKLVEFDLRNSDRVNITVLEQQVGGTFVQTFMNFQRSVDWINGRATPELVIGEGHENAVLTARGD